MRRKLYVFLFSKVKRMDVNHIMINNKSISWSESVKHLGNILYYNLDDSSDIQLKTSEMIFSVNKLCANFNSASIDIGHEPNLKFWPIGTISGD